MSAIRAIRATDVSVRIPHGIRQDFSGLISSRRMRVDGLARATQGIVNSTVPFCLPTPPLTRLPLVVRRLHAM